MRSRDWNSYKQKAVDLSLQAMLGNEGVMHMSCKSADQLLTAARRYCTSGCNSNVSKFEVQVFQKRVEQNSSPAGPDPGSDLPGRIGLIHCFRPASSRSLLGGKKCRSYFL